MKELMCLFTLSEGVSEPWPSVILFFTVSNNTQSLCIAHPIVIFSGRPDLQIIDFPFSQSTCLSFHRVDYWEVD
jgi:hypothetical protein